MIPTSPSLIKKQMKKPPFPVPSSVAESQQCFPTNSPVEQQRQHLQSDGDSNEMIVAPFFNYFMATLLLSSVGFTLFYFHEHFQKKLALLLSSQHGLRNSNINQQIQQQVFTTTRMGGITVATIAVVSSLISWISEKRQQQQQQHNISSVASQLVLSTDNCHKVSMNEPTRNDKSMNNQSSNAHVTVVEQKATTDMNLVKHDDERTDKDREEKSEESVYKIVVTPVLESQPEPSKGQSFSIGGAIAGGNNSKHERKSRKLKKKQQQQRKLQLSQISVNRQWKESEKRRDDDDDDDDENDDDENDDNCYYQQRNNRFGSVFQKSQQKNNNHNRSKKSKSNFLNPFELHKSSTVPKSPISNASACSSIDSAERERFERAVSSGEFYLAEDDDDEDANYHHKLKLVKADSEDCDDEGSGEVEDEECLEENDSNDEISENDNDDEDDDSTCGNDGLPLEDESLPLFVMLVGVPGSGKSTWCSTFESRLHFSSTSFAIIHSDEVRFEITGNINDQTQNEFVWTEVLFRTRTSLGKGINTMLDATNVDTIRRRTFVKQLPPCRLRLKTFFVSESLARSRISKDVKEGTLRSAVPDKALCFMMKKFKESLSRLPEEGWRSFCEEDYLLA